MDTVIVKLLGYVKDVATRGAVRHFLPQLPQLRINSRARDFTYSPETASTEGGAIFAEAKSHLSPPQKICDLIDLYERMQQHQCRQR
jgi:hypothetical protein